MVGANSGPHKMRHDETNKPDRTRKRDRSGNESRSGNVPRSKQGSYAHSTRCRPLFTHRKQVPFSRLHQNHGRGYSYDDRQYCERLVAGGINATDEPSRDREGTRHSRKAAKDNNESRADTINGDAGEQQAKCRYPPLFESAADHKSQNAESANER